MTSTDGWATPGRRVKTSTERMGKRKLVLQVDEGAQLIWQRP